MIHKEKLLLGLAQNVNEELWIRRSEGVDPSSLGIHLLLSPREVLARQYADELLNLIDLLDKIEKLESKAKQVVDFEVLQALSLLKNQVGNMIKRQTMFQDTLSHMMSSNRTVAQDSVSEQSIEPVPAEEGSQSPNAQNNVADMFEEWKYDRVLDYMYKLTQYNFLRAKLLNNASPVQKRRMFRRDLQLAVKAFADGDFFLSRLQLRDVLDTYVHVNLLDDVSYYYCESCYALNYLDEALKGYQSLIQRYPQSEFWSKALMRIIGIYFIYDDVGRIFHHYQILLGNKNRMDATSFSTISYLVGYAYFKSGNYQSAFQVLKNVPANTIYYFPSQYLIGACHSNLGMDNQAIEIYQDLAKKDVRFSDNPILFQIRNNALLKLGLIYYERGHNEQAMSLFNRVSKDHSQYDLSVIGKAWSTYRSGKHDETIKNVEWLLQNALISNYAYEAKVLAASSNEILGHTDKAIEDLRQVYLAGRRADQTDLYVSDRTALIQNVKDIENVETESLEKKYSEIFSEIKQVRKFLRSAGSQEGERYSEGSIQDQEAVKERSRIREEIKNLDLLEQQAKANRRNDLLKEIRDLKSDLIITLNEHSSSSTDIYEDPLIQRMGMAEYLRYLCRSLLTETIREKDQTGKDIQEFTQLLDKARVQDQFTLVIPMEMKKAELEDYFGRLNQYEVWLRENFPQEIKMDLDHWASFSGYGISNINFSRIKQAEHKVAQISQTIAALDQVYEAKRVDLQQRIQGLLTDVVKIEEQMRKEATEREQEERERFFKVEYFYKQRQETPAGKLEEKPKAMETDNP